MPGPAGSTVTEVGATVGGLPLFELMLQVSRELNANAIVAIDCQTMISEIGPERLSNSIIERLQAVDLLSQTLIEIAQVLNRAAASCPADLCLPESFLTSVKLSALRDRLAGTASDPAEHADPELW
jgi:hypothetical protein